MPINANLLNALARPVRSVQDYQDDYTRRDIQAQGLQRNALLLQEGQALQQDRTRTRQESDMLRNALMGAGPNATLAQRAAAARATGLQTGYTFADGLEKSDAEIAAKRATTGKTVQETEAGATKLQFERDDRWRKLVQAAEDPQHAMDLVVGAARQKLLSEPDAMQFIGRLSQDPAKFAQQKAAALAPALAAKELLPTLGSTNLGGSEQYTARNPLTGAVSVSGTAKRSMTPGEVSRLGEDQRQFGVTSGLAADKFAYEKKKDAAEVTNGSKATEGERNAAGYASRMVEATKLLDKHEKDGRSTYRTDIAGGVPFVGNAARTAVMTPEQQQYRQAQEDWVRAKLRKESGAAIGVDEMDREIASYFPQPGEAKPVIDQKRRARAVAVEAMNKASGRAGYESTVPATAQPLSAAEQTELEQLRAKLGRK